MTSIQETVSSALVKRDRAGRTRYTKSYKIEVVTAYQQSGLSAAAFAEHCGVKYPTFISWLTKEKRPASPKTDDDDAQQFIIAEFASAPALNSLKLELPSGVIVHVSSPCQLGLLVELLKALN